MQRPDDKAIRAEERLLNDPLYQAAREPVIELIRRLQIASSAEDMVMLQRDLLVEFGGRQDATDESLPRVKAETKANIRELAGREPKSIDEIRGQQQILARVDEQFLVATAVQHVLREVGDGIAWRALRYDRRAFAILGEGQRVGRLASGVGREAEFGAIGDLWEAEGALALHNDLTNCIRHGDLSIVREVDGGLAVTLAEVKAGESGAAAQLRRLDRATRLLSEHRLISADPATPTLHVTVVPGEYETYLSELRGLLAQATSDGFAWMLLHPCLLVGAVDYRVWGTHVDRYSAMSQAQRLEVGWAFDEPDTIGRTSSMKRMNDRRDNIPSIAPYTIFPLPPENITDLIMGFMDLTISLNYREIESTLTAEDVATTVYRDPEAQRRFLRAETESVGIDLPAVQREQMMTELTTPESLLRLIRHVLVHNEAHPEEKYHSRIVVFESEHETWEPRERGLPAGSADLENPPA